MKKILLILMVTLGVGISPKIGFGINQTVKQQADRLWQEKSYQMAVNKYRQIGDDETLSEEDAVEIKFKLADSLWRIGGAKNQKEAEKTLKDLIDVKGADLWQAEAYESLAELYLQKNRWQHQEEIKVYLNKAKDYWAGAPDVEVARKRFIKVGFTLGDYVSQTWGRYDQSLEGVYKEILKVAKNDADKGRAHYALAMGYANQSHDKKKKQKAEEHFRKVIDKYSSSEWTDDAYYHLGQLHERLNEFKKAVAVYEEMLSHFQRGKSSWVNNIQQRLKNITEPDISVSVGYTFLPDSEIQFNLRWHNVSEANMTLYKMDFVHELQFDETRSATDSSRGVDNYFRLLERLIKSRRYQSFPVERSWQTALKNENKHLWHGANKGLAEWQQEDENEDVNPEAGTLAAGAYLLVVNAGGKKVYDLILVTDIGLVTKTAGRSALFFAFDGNTGQPRQKAAVKYHYRYYNNKRHYVWAEGQGITDENGLLQADLLESDHQNYRSQHNIFAVVSDGTMQAFTQGNYYAYQSGQGQWRLYAFADRPAYRPNEEVSFKGIIRKYDGKHFATSEGMRVKARIYDTRGNQVKEEVYSLNAYGSFAGTLMLDEKASLGEYRLVILTENNNQQLAETPLFRLEEYKLPEFLVNIKPQPKEGQEKARYRLGDEISISLNAQYYFGGAAANADVEYLVYQNSYYHIYHSPKEYPWYYADLRRQNYHRGYGQLMHQGKIKTDEEGKAIFSFTTPKEGQGDLSYHIEARVVDQSRREIKANTDIKVTRNAFYAYLTPQQNLYRPGDTAKVDVKILTANEEPVSTDGKISVIRNWWNTPIIMKGKGSVREGHYTENVLFTKFVKTNERGEVVFEFQPEQDGYYTVKFTGYDAEGSEIESITNVYVCSKQSKDIGYQYSGLQIIAEKDTYAVGETARVMVVANKPDTWVLFTSETQEIHDYQMLHLEGSVKLIEILVTDSYTPNVFLHALSAENYQLKASQLPIIIPPKEKFLNVKIIADKEVYQPREKGSIEIEVTDKKGRPVIGELSLGMVDSSVYYIQSEYAKDIREYFYGTKRQQSVQTQASFYQRQYRKLVRDEDNRLMTEEERIQRKNQNEIVGGERLEEEMFARQTGFKGEGKMAALGAMAPASVMGLADEEMDSSGDELRRKFKKEKSLLSKDSGGSQDSKLETPEVRTDFRSTVIWQPSIVTDENGRANIMVKFPDSLTTWRTTARVITPGTRVGNITHEVKTKKEVIVRLQAPRFFTVRDKVTISANVHNYGKEEKKIKVTIQAEGLEVLGEVSQWVTIAPEGEQRVDWVCLAKQKGKASITVMAQSEEASDAMQREYAVIPHGIEKFIAQAVVLKGNKGSQEISQEFAFNIPKERIKESTSLQMVLSPSIAAALLDALPYLAEYPYGCVEQTMSRFLPTVIVAKAMKELGLSEDQVAAYISDVLLTRENPQGHPKVKTQATFAQINKMTIDGLKRLYDFQHSDGGWGWWKEDDSDRFMTAYVVWGMAMAKQAGIHIKEKSFQRGIAFLQSNLVEEENNPDMLAWMMHAMSYTRASHVLRERLWSQRDQLNPYTRALYAVTEWNLGNSDNRQRAEVLARNLINGVQEDKKNGTVHWGEAGIHYRWSEGGVEATAFIIKALSTINPQSEYLAPAVKWMVLNRRGSRWKNTRDTAIAILGLTEYLKTVNELNPNYDYEIYLNGQSVCKGHVDSNNVFAFDRNVFLSNDILKDGNNQVKVVFKGEGALYLSGYLKYFTLEEDITLEGNEVFVERQYFREVRKETLLKGYVQDWTELKSGDQLKSGDRVKVEVILDAKNHYEYLVTEDYKPAGLEAVELKSGTTYAKVLDEDGHEGGKTTWAYQEFHDQKVVFFITKLPQGKHKLTYELRAEVPGIFHAMPNQTHAMYVPEIRANSDEMRVEVLEKE